MDKKEKFWSLNTKAAIVTGLIIASYTILSTEIVQRIWHKSTDEKSSINYYSNKNIFQTDSSNKKNVSVQLLPKIQAKEKQNVVPTKYAYITIEANIADEVFINNKPAEYCGELGKVNTIRAIVGNRYKIKIGNCEIVNLVAENDMTVSRCK